MTVDGPHPATDSTDVVPLSLVGLRAQVDMRHSIAAGDADAVNPAVLVVCLRSGGGGWGVFL